jgi:hypothetical protein
MGAEDMSARTMARRGKQRRPASAVEGEVDELLEADEREGTAAEVQKGKQLREADMQEEIEAEEELSSLPRVTGGLSASRAPSRSPAQVTRYAAIRYFTRMNPLRMYPFHVTLSKAQLAAAVQKHVEQRTSGPFQAKVDLPIVIEPLLPGCDCYPAREEVSVEKNEVQVTFWVIPQVLGQVMYPRVLIRQEGRCLVEIPLEIRVVKQTLAVVAGTCSLCIPFVSSLLKFYRLDLDSQLQTGFDLYLAAINYVFLHLSPGALLITLAIVTGALYLWMRPRKKDVFWDFAAAQPVVRPSGTALELLRGVITGGCMGVWSGIRLGILVGIALGGFLLMLIAIRTSTHNALSWATAVLLGTTIGFSILGVILGFIAGALEGASAQH